MKRTKIEHIPVEVPQSLLPVLQGAILYDSSCSPEARVWFVDRDGGYYLKTACAGALNREAEMTRFFHQKGIGAEVLDYRTEGERDWLLTRRVPGEDCTHAKYLEDPKRLCDTLATLLRGLHETDPTGCPVPLRTQDYLRTVEQNHRKGMYDNSLFTAEWSYGSAEEAFQVVSEQRYLLKNDTLLHGDYCLPNVMMDDWRFSGFIDVGNGGVGDRHIDLFWGAWTLRFNLKTDAYRDRFFDAYGRDKIDLSLLRVVAAAEVLG
ncbi:MAG: aminoglycoside 3'-phosphotransferase [Clostridia bacterium]|nr:aminoglycoside 3'-phosphotransferase [Clostridia bacterium]